MDAIKMQPDEEGFLFPRIDTDKCIECGLCERSCPTQDPVYWPLMHATPAEVDAAWEISLDERRRSTSGGAFLPLLHDGWRMAEWCMAQLSTMIWWYATLVLIHLLRWTHCVVQNMCRAMFAIHIVRFVPI